MKNQKDQSHKLSARLAKMLQCYTDYTNSETFGNATASAKAAGFKGKTLSSLRVSAHYHMKKLREHITRWLDDEGLSELQLKFRIINGLNAKETKYFSHNGIVTDQRIVNALEVQRKYLEMALKLKGLFPPEKHEITGADGQPLKMNYREISPELKARALAFSAFEAQKEIEEMRRAYNIGQETKEASPGKNGNKFS